MSRVQNVAYSTMQHVVPRLRVVFSYLIGVLYLMTVYVRSAYCKFVNLLLSISESKLVQFTS